MQPVAEAPEQKLTYDEVLADWRATHPDWEKIQEPTARWLANTVRGTISYQQGHGGSPGFYGATVHLRQSGKRLSPASTEHAADTRQGLVEILRSRYEGFREVSDDGKSHFLWLTREETDARRPNWKKRRQPLDILERTTPKPVKRKVGRPRKTATEIDRAAYEDGIKKRVALGVAAGQASSATWQATQGSTGTRGAAAKQAAREAVEKERQRE